jgi:hypothetical protein
MISMDTESIGTHAIAIRVAAELLHSRDHARSVHEWKTEILAMGRIHYLVMSLVESEVELMENLAILEALRSRRLG